VLALEHFAADHRPAPGYYVERLEDHLARFPMVSLPHAHSFYLILYVTQGQGTHTIDLVTYGLRPGGLYSADTQGYILFFSAAFYQRQYPADRLAAYPFFDPAQRPAPCLTPTESTLRGLLAIRVAHSENGKLFLAMQHSKCLVIGGLY